MSSEGGEDLAVAPNEQPEGEESEGDGSQGSQGDGGDEEGDKGEFQPTVFVAKPYHSEFVEETEKEVKELITQNTRPLMKIRLSKKRREFNNDQRTLNDKEGGECSTDVKPRNMKILTKDRRVLDMGLQAARQMKTFRSQTYFNRSVNYSCQYNPDDFIGQMSKFKEDDLDKKIESFMDVVAPRVEEAL